MYFSIYIFNFYSAPCFFHCLCVSNSLSSSLSSTPYLFHFVCPTPCVSPLWVPSRMCSITYIPFCVSHSVCVPLPACSTPYVFHSMSVPLRVSRCVYVPFRLFHSVYVPLHVCTYHSMYVPLHVCVTATPVSFDPYFVVVSQSFYLPPPINVLLFILLRMCV